MLLLSVLLAASAAHAEDSLAPLSSEALFAPAPSMQAPAPAVAPAATAVHKKWIVDAKRGPGTDVATLKEAVRNANSGDEIELRPGRYHDYVMIDKDLTIRGATTSDGKIAVTIFAGEENLFNFINGKSRLENLNLEQEQVTTTHNDNVVGIYAQKGELSLSNITITTKSSPAMAIDGAKVTADHLRLSGQVGLQMNTGTLYCEFCEANGCGQTGWFINGLEDASTAITDAAGHRLPMARFKQLKATGNGANGLEVAGNAVVEVEDGMFTGNQANGVQAAATGRVKCSQCQASNNLLSGMLAVGMSQIEAISSRANSNMQAGFAAGETGRVTAKDSEANANQQVGAATNGTGQVIFDNTKAEGNKIAARAVADTAGHTVLDDSAVRAPASNNLALPGAKP